MKKIYLDNNFICHLTNEGGMKEIETDVFDGVINDVIPYYRYIPNGEEWVNPKTGMILHGLFVQAIDSVAIDKKIQLIVLQDMREALNILGVTEE